MKKTYKIKGLDCPACSLVIESDLADAGIKAKCNYATCLLEIEGDHHKGVEMVRNLGYELEENS